MPIKKEMINGLKRFMARVTFAFADSALAFLLTIQEMQQLNCTINFTKTVRLGDTEFCRKYFAADTRKPAVYDIKITQSK